MLCIDIAGALITNDDYNVLLARHPVPLSYEVLHELPGVVVSEREDITTCLVKGLRNEYGLDVVPQRSCSTLIYTEGNGFVAAYHVLKARLETTRYLCGDKWRFADLRRNGVGVIGLGVYATELTWKIQNEEVAL